MYLKYLYKIINLKKKNIKTVKIKWLKQTYILIFSLRIEYREYNMIIVVQ